MKNVLKIIILIFTISSLVKTVVAQSNCPTGFTCTQNTTQGVISPKINDVWEKGQNHIINWNALPYSNKAHVSIVLNHADSYSVGVIKDIFISNKNQIADQSYVWDVNTLSSLTRKADGTPYPVENFQPGEYQIRITVTNYEINPPTVVSIDSPVFKIAKSKLPFCNIGSPSILGKGPYYLTFPISIENSSSSKYDLTRDGTLVYTTIGNISDGNYSWIDQSAPEGVYNYSVIGHGKGSPSCDLYGVRVGTPVQTKTNNFGLMASIFSVIGDFFNRLKGN